MEALYDPFQHGPFPVGVRTIDLTDSKRGDRQFPCEVWFPESTERGRYPLVVFSHSSGGNRRQSTFLTTHLASHGYVAAALDHSEIVANELHRKDGESAVERAARTQASIANRVPDVRFLLDQLLSGAIDEFALIEQQQVGIIGHSFGGWTALASAETETRVRAIVALVPAGSSRPVPGVLPVTLTFEWGRDVPTLYLAAEFDVATPLSGIRELFERTPGSKRMFVLRRSDHAHFMDDAEKIHEGFRLLAAEGDLAAMIAGMRPFAELCSAESAHSFTRALALAHMDAHVKQRDDAAQFLAEKAAAALASHEFDVIEIRDEKSAIRDLKS